MAEPPSLDSYCAAGTYDSSSGGSDGSYPFSHKVEGYDYDFVPPVDGRYECAICLMVLREPRQTPCGHRFCRDCILKWLRESHTRCPADNEEISEKDLFPDNFAKREIQNFTVRCPNSKQGCDVIATVKEIPIHQNSCPLALVPCPNQCTHVLLRRDLDQHMSKTCDRRSLLCPDCSSNFLAVEYEDHAQSCPQGKVRCQMCGEEIIRQELSQHTEELCPKAVVSCNFNMLGCEAQMMRCELESHLAESTVAHLNMLCHGVTHLFRYLHIPPLSGERVVTPKEDLSSAEMSGAMVGMVPLVYNLSALNTGSFQPAPAVREAQQSTMGWSLPPASQWSLPQASQPFKTPTSSSSLDLAVPSPLPNPSPLHRSPSDPKYLMGGAPSMVSQEASMLQYRSDGAASRGLEMPPSYGAGSGSGSGRQALSSTCVSSVQDEQKLVMHDQKLLELQLKFDNLDRNYRQKLKELSEIEGRICNGQFFWKIHNYSRYQHEAERGETTALHSLPFYSAPSGGYKMCVRANLHGVDSARGSYMSLFIHFMQGEYDDVLDWPFSGRIILSVMDQNDCCELRNHVAETLTAKPNLAAFQKPTTPRNHKGFGYMEFLPLSALKHSSYIKNDTMIIKVHVLPIG